MKIFAIRENKKDGDLGYLFYYEKAKEYYIELIDGLDEWNVPLILSSLYKKGLRTINSYWSYVWVSNRIVPQDRQNIGQILRDNNLKQYDEFDLLVISSGRCEQDNFYISRINEDELPLEIKERRTKLVENVFLRKNKEIIVFFKNDTIKLCDLSSYDFEDLEILTDGYGVALDGKVIISNTELYNIGKTIPLKIEDFEEIIKSEVINTVEAMGILNCTRQYINELVKKGTLKPIKSSEKSTLFLKSDVVRLTWL